ncbi:cation/H+ exchanger [Grosmannia clavigera kw1407]|uniref:Cation/H+ exchanger n=1 Tax=Grosmannia clavigera (strain kw1407 / UAMH 11150) TaxID=655863 RepID=F0XBF6_GROCL|nr:cation/H+ exchanger [Grosmannia clavigera kw1407]EFX05006.1 cation/H+ exchanger [Grosmannia clavigera kw1407]
MPITYAAALAYEEPPIRVVLVQTFFLLLLNVLNWALDALLYSGLVGQILIGMAWGTPGAGILSLNTEHAVVQIGYLGLILLVYEGGLVWKDLAETTPLPQENAQVCPADSYLGGLSTAFPSLRANIALSASVAATGIAAPIGLSFVLLRLVTSNGTSSSSLAAFAAGAALCSTSLGTAFTVLRTSGLAATRLGVVLAGAAMLDDVVGLVMVQVIASLGPRSAGATDVSAATVVRPVLVSVAFAVVAVLLCRFVVQPATAALNSWRSAHEDARISWLFRQSATALVLHTALLVAMVAGASYARTSNLFAAYVAGAIISWWDSEVLHCSDDAVSDDHGSVRDGDASGNTRGNAPLTSGCDIFDHYYRPAAKWVLQPFFFASIGFSIPVTKMFVGEIVWKGIVYAVLMCIGKLVCGLWLVRFPDVGIWIRSMVKNRQLKASEARQDTTEVELHERKPPASSRADTGTLPSPEEKSKERNTLLNPPKPLSLYPAAILGVAMVPRGEIGFLIAAVAQSHGVFGQEMDSGTSDVFLLVTWAIVLCTLLGPPCVGLLVRRVRRLEGQAAGRDVLGVWGIRSDSH